MISISKIQSKLKKNGFCILENFYSNKKCDLIKIKLEKILNLRIKKNKYVGKKNTIVLYNYFLEDKSLIELVYNKRINRFLSKILEKDYGLTSASARNKMFFNLNNSSFKKQSASGNKWHRDNRYVGGRGVHPSLSYFVITAIEDISRFNGCTKYIPNSHKKFTKISKNKVFKKFKFLEAKKGSIIILDTNLVHIAGKPTGISRWTIFNMYSPWYIKPYYEYYNIKKIPKFSKLIKKILHYYYVPPIDYNEDRSTIKNIKI